MKTQNFSIECVDLNNNTHCENLVRLLNGYMDDEMGRGKPMAPGFGEKLISGLKNYPGYLGFFVKERGEFIGIANCNSQFSTFLAKPVLNIHDFFIEKEYRMKGAGLFLMGRVIDFSMEKGYCKMTLEVREDNSKAQHLYKKTGFRECVHKMMFWENKLDNPCN